jgi:hypothetical protein
MFANEIISGVETLRLKITVLVQNFALTFPAEKLKRFFPMRVRQQPSGRPNSLSAQRYSPTPLD